MSSFRLDHKAIAVTGAGRGLGRAYALASAAAGARMIINDVDATAAAETVDLITAAGGRAIALPGAVEDPSTSLALVEAATNTFGGLDGFIANAAVLGRSDLLSETPENARRTVEINLLGTIYCGLAAAPALRQSGGVLVLVTSGARFGQAGVNTYGATKGAIASLVWGWAAEMAPHGVRVNGISPVADTPMFRVDRGAHTDAPSPDAIAPLAVFLLSDEASAVTGRILRMNGETLSMYDSADSIAFAIQQPHWTVANVAKAVAEQLASITGDQGD